MGRCSYCMCASTSGSIDKEQSTGARTRKGGALREIMNIASVEAASKGKIFQL